MRNNLSTIFATLCLLFHGTHAKPPPAAYRDCLKVPPHTHNETAHDHCPQTLFAEFLEAIGATQLPAVYDYRLSKDVVSPVKDQGMCGSCWAFSSAESLEGQLGLNGHRINVSTQIFVDCVAQDYGCDGGWMNDALAYAEAKGVTNDTAYPYVQNQQTCNTSATPTIKPTAYVQVPHDDEALKRALVTVGPVSIALDATGNFQEYNASDYIFNDTTCDPTTPDHALLLVGYNDVEGYWIVKNSWNTDWGCDGYIYINSTTPNMCGIAGFASVPYIEPQTDEEAMHRLRSHIDAIPPTIETVVTVTVYTVEDVADTSDNDFVQTVREVLL